MKKVLHFLPVILFLIFLPDWLFAQEKTITGKVTDANMAPLTGVTISINKSNKGTITDADGKFTLALPATAKLTVSALGFKTKIITADAAQNDIQVKMEEDFAKLDEVVVTGLATNVKRRNLANAVATISSKQLNGVAPAQTFDAALNGKISGAYINSNTGAPGGGISVKLRGVTSIYGNTQPLYVVDGVFIDNTATSGGLNAVTNAASGGSPLPTRTMLPAVLQISVQKILITSKF